jgi:dihydroflavonol-4-reductase
MLSYTEPNYEVRLRMTAKLKLITGGTGRIGNVLLKELCKREEPTRVLVRTTSDLSAIKGCVYEQVVGDILDPDSLDKACKGVDAVFHLAGKINISTYDRNETFDTNVTGTKNVIQACLRNNVRRLVYTSSIHAFSLPPDGQTITEQTPLCSNPDRGLYDCSKAAATEAILHAVEYDGLDAVIVAPTGVIGPYDYRPSYFGKAMLSLLQSGMRISVNGAYNYVDVRDVVAGILAAFEKGKSGEMYILSGDRLTMRDYISYLKEFSGTGASTRYLSERLAHVIAQLFSFFNKESELTPYSLKTLLSNSQISHEKATRELGFHPRPVKESLKDQYDWFVQNGMIKGSK